MIPVYLGTGNVYLGKGEPFIFEPTITDNIPKSKWNTAEKITKTIYYIFKIATILLSYFRS